MKPLIAELAELCIISPHNPASHPAHQWNSDLGLSPERHGKITAAGDNRGSLGKPQLSLGNGLCPSDLQQPSHYLHGHTPGNGPQLLLGICPLLLCLGLAQPQSRQGSPKGLLQSVLQKMIQVVSSPKE